MASFRSGRSLRGRRTADLPPLVEVRIIGCLASHWTIPHVVYRGWIRPPGVDDRLDPELVQVLARPIPDSISSLRVSPARR